MSPGAVAAVAPCEGTGSPQLGRSPRLRSWTSERQGCGWASRAIKAGEEEVVTVRPVQCPTLIQLSGNSCWPGTGREPRQRQVRKLPGCSVMGMVEGQCGWEALGEGKHLPANWPAWLSDVKEISQGRRSWGARQGAKCPPPHSSGPPKGHPSGLHCLPQNPSGAPPHPNPGSFYSSMPPPTSSLSAPVSWPFLRRKVNNIGLLGKLWPARFRDGKSLERERALASVPVSQRQIPGPLPVPPSPWGLNSGLPTSICL